MTNGPDITFFLPSGTGGGAERVISTVASELSSRGYTVDLVLGETDGTELSSDMGMTIVGFDKNRITRCVRPLVRYLRTADPDVFVSTIYITNIIAAVSHLIARSNSKLVFRVANTPSVHLSSSAPRHIIARAILPFVYQRSDKLIAVSEGVRSDLIANFSVNPQNVSVIHNPINIYEIDNRATAPIEHPWFASDRSVKPIVAIGRLTAQKDFPTLLRAFKQVYESDPDVRLAILGSGELQEELEELATSLSIDTVTEFVGYVNNPYPYLARADLFVLSSTWEGLPSTILEALVCRCPVVATDCPSGPREILADGKYGRLVPVGDPGALATAIAAELEEPHNGELLRERAADFEVKHIVDEYEQVLVDVRK